MSESAAARLREVTAERDRYRDALEDAATYLRLAHTWIADTDRHLKMKRAWERATAVLHG